MDDAPTLSWTNTDIEHRFAFRGGRFTRVNTLFTLLNGVLLTIVFFLVLIPLEGTYFHAMFTHRGPVPYSIVGFFFWSLSILVVKAHKLALQRKALPLMVVPDDPEFVLSPTTVDDVLANIYRAVDDPKHFVLFNRIVIALSNLKNLGRVSDVDEILRSQASHDESAMETSYLMLQVFVWAIPVLGFIGTVLGLSQAIGGFGGVVATTTEMSELRPALQEVTAGLATAFETTLEGLVAALAVQLMLTALRKTEEEFLDACSDYTIRHLVGRLRLMPYQPRED